MKLRLLFCERCCGHSHKNGDTACYLYGKEKPKYRCGYCGEDHSYRACNPKERTLICLDCEGNHSVFNPICPDPKKKAARDECLRLRKEARNLEEVYRRTTQMTPEATYDMVVSIIGTPSNFETLQALPQASKRERNQKSLLTLRWWTLYPKSMLQQHLVKSRTKLLGRQRRELPLEQVETAANPLKGPMPKERILNGVWGVHKARLLASLLRRESQGRSHADEQQLRLGIPREAPMTAKVLTTKILTTPCHVEDKLI